MWKKWTKRGLVGTAALLVAIQLVPYGRSHTNPQITSEPEWSDPTVRTLAVRACFDCHSNETRWPWYSNVAPISWLLQRDVDLGRRHLNFSEWDRPQKDAKDAPKEIQEGEMPMWIYTAMHREGRLTPREREVLVDGLKVTLGASKMPQSDRRRTGLERWLANADLQIRAGITRVAVQGW